jgi:hypothetical protein
MKTAAVILIVLVLIAGALLVYQLVNLTLSVTPVSAQVIPCNDQEPEFRRVQQAVDERALIGTVLQQAVPGNAGDYSFIIYSVKVKNNGFLPARMTEIQVSPLATDMLFYTDGSAQGVVPNITVPAGGSQTLRCVLLTQSIEGMHAVRDIYVTYYIWGHPFTVKVTYG